MTRSVSVSFHTLITYNSNEMKMNAYTTSGNAVLLIRSTYGSVTDP